MRIFVDGHFLGGKKQGVAVYIERLYAVYAKLRGDCKIIFGVNRGTQVDVEILSNSNVLVVQYPIGGKLRYLFDIPYLCDKHKIDIIHTQYVLPIVIGKKTLRHVTIHDVLFEDYPQLFSGVYRCLRHYLFYHSAVNADILTTVSIYSLESIERHYGPKNVKCELIPPGATIKAYICQEPEILVPEFNRYIIYVSRFEKRKNHHRLVLVFERLKKRFPDLGLVLVGFDVDGSMGALKTQIEALDLNESVKFMAGISDDIMFRLIKEAAAVVYPSLCEGFGIPILEALFVNPKTLFSATSAMAEFTFASSNMFDPMDLESMEEKIAEYLSKCFNNSEDWFIQKEKIIERYNWNLSAAKLGELYNRTRAEK